MDTAWAHASEIAAAVGDGRTSAAAVVDAALARIAKHDRVLNAFTAVVGARARAKAEAIDAERAKGRLLGTLAGVPFAVKNLFDVAGLPTLAGSKINRERAPAQRDATLIERLEAQGAVLVGALNMGEYAYDFTGENVHDGPSRNPHDPRRMTGGSSGGSGGCGRRRAGPHCARLGHEWINTRAGLAVRNFRPEADLRPALARPHLSVRGEPRSCRPLCP